MIDTISSYDWMRKSCFENEIVQIQGYFRDNPSEAEEGDFTNIRLNVLQYMKRELNYINEMIYHNESSK